MKSLFKKPATLMYPVIAREWQERTRGAVAINPEDCIGCGICTKVCPKSCIEIVDKRAKQDNKNCLTCLACVNACPKKALKFPIPNERFPYPEPNPNVRFKNPNVTLQEIINANCQK